MRRPILVAASIVAAVASAAQAQHSSTYSAAIPPSTERLDRLNLKTEWVVNLPIDGRKDSVARIDVVDANQIFAQTRSGVLIALDGKTGQQQWLYRFPDRFSAGLSVAVNSRYVFVANFSRLYAFQRYNGMLEFSFEPTVKYDVQTASISSSPICDEKNVYVVVGSKEILAYRIPEAIKQPEPAANRNATAMAQRGSIVPNPADQIAQRYPGTRPGTERVDEVAPSRAGPPKDITVNVHQSSPSISVLPSVRPPYELRDRYGINLLKAESLSTLPSMRQPFTLYDKEGRYVNKTPSVTVMPASVHRAYELNDIRPRGLTPERDWLYQATNRIAQEPLIAGARMWVSFQSPRVLAFDRLEGSQDSRTVQTEGTLSAPVAASMSADGPMGYFALADGSLIAVDLLFGGKDNRGALRQMWRANFGGAMNRKPLVTATAVFVGGDAAGVGLVHRERGELVWRTADRDDFLMAANEERAYVRSQTGELHVYDLRSPVDPTTKRTVPQAEMDISGFGIRVSNTQTDRLLLASDNGLLVCLRDSAAKYFQPRPNLPPKAAPAAPKKDGDAAPAPAADPMKPMAGDAAKPAGQ